MSNESKAACGVQYRNAGAPVPAWWPGVRQLFLASRNLFPPDISPAFIGSWIERESDGQYAQVSSMGEVGYFQLSPGEVVEMVGQERASNVISQIKSSPAAAMQWGGKYLSRYDARLVGLGVKRGTETYYGLMKAMHWNPVQTPRWVQHVKHALGKLPKSYEAFIDAANRVRTGSLPAAPGVVVPPNLPGCAAFYVLDRAPVFGTWPPKSSSLAAVFGIASAAILVAGLIGVGLAQLEMGRFVTWKGSQADIDRQPPS